VLTRRFRNLLENNPITLVSAGRFASKLHITERRLSEAIKAAEDLTATEACWLISNSMSRRWRPASASTTQLTSAPSSRRSWPVTPGIQTQQGADEAFTPDL
jgi:hypothetical protein